MLTTAEAALIDELKRAARVLGAPLLDAETRDELNDTIERVILLPEFQQFNDSAGKLVVIIIDSASFARSSDEPPIALVSVLGTGPASIVEQGMRLIPAMLSVITQLAVTAGSPVSTSRPTIAEFFAQSGLHSTILSGIFAGTCSGAALLGVAHAVFESVKLPPWLALALAETFRDGVCAHLRVLASLPVDVPETIVPLTDRYDLDGLQRSVAQAEATFDAIGEIVRCEVA